MKDSNGNDMTNENILKQGLQHLDDALMFIMELEGVQGEALAHFIHAALTFGEKLITPVDAQ